MNRQEKLAELMARVLNLPLSRITSGTSQDSTSEWDSMNHLLLITEIEKEFNLSIPIEKSIELVSFQSILEFLENEQKD